jgi:integrase
MAVKLEKTKTPGVFKRGNRYLVTYRDARGEQRRRSARTYAEARDLKAAVTTDVRRGEHHEASRMTLEAYAGEWIDSYQGRSTRGFRESTREGYRRSVEKKIVPFFSKRAATLTQLEPRDVRMFITWLFDDRAQGRRLAVSTVRSHVAALRAMLATAVEDGLLRHNPASGVRISRPGTPSIEQEPSDTRRALDTNELARLLARIDPEWRRFFELLAMTGVRISEALELRWGDVDFGRKRLRIRRQIYHHVIAEPKSRHGRRDIPLSTAMLQGLWSAQGPPDALLFAGPRGTHMDRDWLRLSVLKPAAKAAGVPWAGFHTFRHTCASILFANGRNPNQVQMWLGHSDPGFTLRTYVHLIDDGLGDADFLDTAWVTTKVTTRPAETTANDVRPSVAEMAV